MEATVSLDSMGGGDVKTVLKKKKQDEEMVESVDTSNDMGL